MEKSRLPYGGSRIGRSALGGEHTCGPDTGEQCLQPRKGRRTASRCTGIAERRPGPHEGKAEVVGEETGRGTYTSRRGRGPSTQGQETQRERREGPPPSRG